MKFKKLKAEIEELEDKLTTNNNIQESIQQEQKEIINEMKKIGIERLPYSYSSLGRFIDPKTMNVHYNKHYKGYVEKLNVALEKVKGADHELEDIVKGISRYSKIVKNNAGGAFNHALFWKMLSPKKQEVNGPVFEKIKKDFGSYEEFKKQFIDKAQKNFGSGWCWLVINNQGKLKIVTTANQDNPLMNTVKDGGYPILGLDTWEHAYYLRYQNKKDEYIGKFFSVINWDFVNTLYNTKNEKKINEEKMVKDLLVETKESIGCSTQQVREINQMFAMNPQVKYKFRHGIDNILKLIFEPYWHEKDQYEQGSMSGIYDYGNKGRSVLNKLNTNYSSFCILMNDLNVYMVKTNKKPISFTGKNKEEQLRETDKFVKQLYDLKERIFDVDRSKTFQTIIQKLVQTDKKGEEREDVTVIALKKIFETDDVNKIGGLGSEEDMISGVDAVINKDGKKLTAQIKPFSSITPLISNEEKVMVFGASAPKQYNTDYLVFNNRNKTVVFINKKTEIIDGNYVFPKSNLFGEL